MQKTFFELINVNKAYGSKLDFYGENSPFTKSEREEYLTRYGELLKSVYGKDILFCKAYNRADALKAAEIFEGEEYSAYTLKKPQTMLNWHFYTNRVKISNGEISFNDNYTLPVAAAKYEIDGDINCFEFCVKNNTDYKGDISGGVLTNTQGRFVEFRRGCLPVLRIQFFTNGKVTLRRLVKDNYHYTDIFAPDFKHGERYNVKVSFNEGGIEAVCGGKTVLTDYDRDYRFKPDNVFISGGLQPYEKWSFKPIAAKTSFGEVTEFFTPCNNIDSEPERYIGNAKLPYVLGTEANKDSYLILKRKFSYVKGERCELCCNGIDPCGEVYVNGKLAYTAETFDPFVLDITKLVNAGENELVIKVEPRAPECNYPWHRHRDLYNGWFVLETKINRYKAVSNVKIKVTTVKTGELTDFYVKADYEYFGSKPPRYTVYLQKIFPEQLEAQKIASGYGEVNINKSMPVELWSPNNPVLYKVTVSFELNGKTDEASVETGFRTISQRGGELYINDERITLCGALNMQFLPPYENIPLTHVCPDSVDIAGELLSLKGMNGNCMRMHQLGYGTNDTRFARLCDRLGITLIWTTRYIDSLENAAHTKVWKQKERYFKSAELIYNNPSVIILEGSNEFHGSLKSLDKMYDEFVSSALKYDSTRLLCPVSHIYYGGGIYDQGCEYYTDCGGRDQDGNPAYSSFGYINGKVVRSAHTYSILLGYGGPWSDMREQRWKNQSELFNSKNHAYLVSEFAVIGRENPHTEGAATYINKNSYELGDESSALGYEFGDDKWEISQAFQAFCAYTDVKQLRLHNADSMLWCCLRGGANDGSYLKPVIDFNGYTKLAYYALKSGFESIAVFNAGVDVINSGKFELSPVICSFKDGYSADLTAEIYNDSSELVYSQEYKNAKLTAATRLESKVLELSDGFYTVKFKLDNIKESH